MPTLRPWTLPIEPTTRGQLLQLGVTDGMIRSQVAAGRLVRLRAGVFVAAGVSETELNLLTARAEQTRRPEAVISHQSAASYWRLPTPSGGSWQQETVSLTVAGGNRSHRPGVTYHQAALPDSAVTKDSAGYQITTPARTAIDLAAGLALPKPWSCWTRRCAERVKVS